MHDVENFRYIGKNKIIELTRPENIILKLLMQNKGNLVTFEELVMTVYGELPDYSYTRCIVTHITRMNKKLKGELHIRNRRGIGYMLM
jgi:DNA-binding response OmpR family regulator